MVHSTDQREPPKHYYEQYALAVEMADRVTARRGVANTFFATVNAGLVTLLGNQTVSRYAAIAGIVLAFVWFGVLKSYRDLNAAKFSVINDLEKQLPAKVFTEEWMILKKEPIKIGWGTIVSWLGQYREFGTVERYVPFVFIVIYGFVLVRMLLV